MSSLRTRTFQKKVRPSAGKPARRGKGARLRGRQYGAK